MSENATVENVAVQPFKAYAVVPLGKEDLWELREIEITGESAKITRSSVPNTKEICTARAMAGLDGFDPFQYGTGAESASEPVPPAEG